VFLSKNELRSILFFHIESEKQNRAGQFLKHHLLVNNNDDEIYVLIAGEIIEKDKLEEIIEFNCYHKKLLDLLMF
jgi:ABC-type dipeptide/oligopeptide/nickel transport system ATPase component